MKTIDTNVNLQEFYPANLDIQEVKTFSDKVTVRMKSNTRAFVCPKCKTQTNKYHAVHKRNVQDLPILGKQTILSISLYEFDCVNPNCDCKSVTENFDGFLNEYSRMTERLADLVADLAIETSCEGASRILNSMHIKVSGDTVIRTLLRRYSSQPEKICGSCIGVDDFAFKKRYRYGTIIVDEETHSPVKILEGRGEEVLKEWLKQNKHVTTITRDRASAYAKAIEEILPESMQIADRFHLHQNLLESVNKIIGKTIPATVAIPKKEIAAGVSQTGSYEEKPVKPHRRKKNAHRCG